jgi:hypothetical protein
MVTLPDAHLFVVFGMSQRKLDRLFDFLLKNIVLMKTRNAIN